MVIGLAVLKAVNFVEMITKGGKVTICASALMAMP